MNRSHGKPPADDRALVAAVLAGDADAWARLKERAAGTLYQAACRYYDDETAAVAEVRNLLVDIQADGGAVLQRYRSGTLETFLALVADTLLGARLSAMFASDSATAWSAFERRFTDDVRRRIRRHFRIAPGETLPSGRDLEDIYNDFVLHIVAKRYAPLAAYDGSGEASFSWFLLNRVVVNWCRDEHRREYARWRPPEAIKKLPPLEQRVFEMMDRDHACAAEVIVALVDEGEARVEAAIDAVFRTHPPGTRGRPIKEPLVRTTADGTEEEVVLPDAGRTPEAVLGDSQEALAAACAIANLPDEERLVLVLWLEHDDMSAVARIMSRSVPEARRIKERAVRRARRFLEEGTTEKRAEARDLVRLFPVRST